MPQLPPIQFIHEQLKNGLEVILYRNNRIPLTHVTLHYRVGSSHETKGKSGLAHLFEHLMFQGSHNVGKAEHGRYIDSVGGRWNATTSKDRTNYYQTIPSSALDLALWLEADRLQSLEVNPENFENQRQTVIEEKKQSYDNCPYGSAFLRFDELAYENWAYGHPIIGSVKDLEKMTVGDASDFHTKHYGPDRCVLVISGDIDESHALKRVEHYFGSLRGQTNPLSSPDLSEPKQKKEKIEDIHDELAPLSAAYMGYHMPPSGTLEHYSLSMLATILARGQSSRLYRRLVYENNWATGLSVGPNQYHGPQMFCLWMQFQQEVSQEVVLNAIEDELKRVRQDPVPADELEKARNQILYRAASNRERVETLGESLARFATCFGDPSLINRETDRFLDVTAIQILEAAQQTLTRQNRTVLLIQNNSSEIDR